MGIKSRDGQEISRYFSRDQAAKPKQLVQPYGSIWFLYHSLFAFFENQSVPTITKPEKNNNNVGVGTLELKIRILNSEGNIPDDDHISYDWNAAIGTPIKLTKSLPAKANAKANVPIPIINLKRFSLVNRSKI